MNKIKPRLLRCDYGLTLQQVADRFSPVITRQAVLAIEKAEGVKPRTALRYEEAVRLAVSWRNEMRNVRKRFRLVIDGALEKAERKVGRLRS
jgi:hypothetical protein